MEQRSRKRDRIRDLLSLHLSGRINSEELKELYSVLNEKHNTNLDECLNNDWLNSPEKNTGFHSHIQFIKLRDELGIPENNDKPEIENSNPVRHSNYFIHPVFKYAAVLLIGLFSGLLVYNKVFHGDYRTAEINPTSISVEKGSKSSITLPDGSKVRLNSDSKIIYKSDFGNKSRTVTLYGEGFFEVTENSHKPFYVKTEQITVKVLGTSFNVRSYRNEDITETTLVTGKVEILSNRSKSEFSRHASQEVIAKLSPNQKFSISKSGERGISLVKEEHNNIRVKKVKVPNAVILDNVNLETDISWQNDILVFNNEPFSEIAKSLERWYNVNITIEYNALNEVRFSAKFDKESVDDVLKALTLIEPFNYSIKKDQITILK